MVHFKLEFVQHYNHRALRSMERRFRKIIVKFLVFGYWLYNNSILKEYDR
jgi:hypothetical protein